MGQVTVAAGLLQTHNGVAQNQCNFCVEDTLNSRPCLKEAWFNMGLVSIAAALSKETCGYTGFEICLDHQPWLESRKAQASFKPGLVV